MLRCSGGRPVASLRARGARANPLGLRAPGMRCRCCASLLGAGIPRGTLFNINFPHCEAGGVTGTEARPSQGQRDQTLLSIRRAQGWAAATLISGSASRAASTKPRLGTDMAALDTQANRSPPASAEPSGAARRGFGADTRVTGARPTLPGRRSDSFSVTLMPLKRCIFSCALRARRERTSRCCAPSRRCLGILRRSRPSRGARAARCRLAFGECGQISAPLRSRACAGGTRFAKGIRALRYLRDGFGLFDAAAVRSGIFAGAVISVEQLPARSPSKPRIDSKAPVSTMSRSHKLPMTLRGSAGGGTIRAPPSSISQVAEPPAARGSAGLRKGRSASLRRPAAPMCHIVRAERLPGGGWREEIVGLTRGRAADRRGLALFLKIISAIEADVPSLKILRISTTP